MSSDLHTHVHTHTCVHRWTYTHVYTQGIRETFAPPLGCIQKEVLANTGGILCTWRLSRINLKDNEPQEACKPFEARLSPGKIAL